MFISSQNWMLRFLVAFAAGFISVILFHQGTLALLNQINLTQFPPYSTDSTQPFGIAAIWSMAFWGGLWGIVLAVLLRLHKKGVYWLTALFFGAFAPTTVFLFVVLPLKGMPVAGGWQLSLIATGLLTYSTTELTVQSQNLEGHSPLLAASSRP